jgi:hypothetical protein
MAKADVEAMLSWDNLTPEVHSAFDNGAPIGIIRAILDTPREEQFNLLQNLVGAGVTHMKGATRVLNAERKRQPFATTITTTPLGVETPPTADNKPPSPRTAVQRPHPKTARKVAESIGTMAASGNLHEEGFVECFAAGMVHGILWMLGEDVQKSLPADVLAKLINALPKGQQ